jgi:hypothetical protein
MPVITNYFRMDGWVKSAQGPAIPGAQIYVCTQPANTVALPPSPLANIFADVNGLVPITQPILTDGDGHYDFYAQAAVYTIVVGFGGVVQEFYPDQSLGGASGTSGGGGGTALVIQVNGATPANQLLLNLQGAGNTSVSTDGAGNVTITGSGIPTGGTAGQVLTKIDGTDFNTEWVTPAAATSGQNIFAFPQFQDEDGGLSNFTLVAIVPAALVQATGTSAIVKVITGGNLGGTGFVVTGASIGATVPRRYIGGIITNNLAWTSLVPFTFPAGSFSTINTTYPSNPVSITIDSDHDYYILVYLDTTNTGNVPSTGLSTIPLEYTGLWGYVSGNHTADADATQVQTLSGSGQLHAICQAVIA